jgi:hypothetical protein
MLPAELRHESIGTHPGFCRLAKRWSSRIANMIRYLIPHGIGQSFVVIAPFAAPLLMLG